MFKSILSVCLLSVFIGCVANASTASPPSTIAIASLNIRVFGLGGEYAAAESDEFRSKWLKEYIFDYLKKPDVIAFQEILDVAKLRFEVMGTDYVCHSYDESSRNYHVVLCHLRSFDFVKDGGDDNLTWEDIGQGNLRPAVHGLLKSQSGAPIAHIVALHLKAMPDGARKRLSQVELIQKHLQELNDGLPVVMTGDFNTYPAKDTGLAKDDTALYDEILQRGPSQTLARVPNPGFPTYRTFEFSIAFDHFWISPELKTVGPLQVATACRQADDSSGKRFDNIWFYNKFVSDHCSILVNLKVN